MSRRNDPLLQLLPSRRQDALRAAIGGRLLEIERLFATTPEDFVQRGGRPEDYFARASGATQLRFDNGVVHALCVLPSELSLLVLDRTIEPDDAAELHRLTADAHAPAGLRDLIGARVEDVRIWSYAEDEVPSDEAREVAVSYVFSGGRELFYVIYLHGDLDSDYLMLGGDVRREHVAACRSVQQGDAP